MRPEIVRVVPCVSAADIVGMSAGGPLAALTLRLHRTLEPLEPGGGRQCFQRAAQNAALAAKRPGARVVRERTATGGPGKGATDDPHRNVDKALAEDTDSASATLTAPAALPRVQGRTGQSAASDDDGGP